MEKELTFKEKLAMIRVAFKKGDMEEVAKRAGTTPTTVRKTFTREYAVELTEAEKRVYNVCQEYFKERFEEAAKIDINAKGVI